MKKLLLTAALGAACLALAGCGDGGDKAGGNDAAAAGEGNGSEAAAAGNGSASASAFPTGARIVEENGVTYRVDADGTRVRLGDNESRIVVEDGVRFRVDPDGSRVRINPEGVAVDVDLPDVDLPDVDVGINEKGNPDVDVTDRNESR